MDIGNVIFLYLCTVALFVWSYFNRRDGDTIISIISFVCATGFLVFAILFTLAHTDIEEKYIIPIGIALILFALVAVIFRFLLYYRKEIKRHRRGMATILHNFIEQERAVLIEIGRMDDVSLPAFRSLPCDNAAYPMILEAIKSKDKTSTFLYKDDLIRKEIWNSVCQEYDADDDYFEEIIAIRNRYCDDVLCRLDHPSMPSGYKYHSPKSL